MPGAHAHVSSHSSHTHGHNHNHTTHPTNASHVHHNAHHGAYSENRASGLKAAVNNPRTTHAGRTHAQHELHSMGYPSAHPSLGTRLRHFFHLPAKSHGKTHHHGYSTGSSHSHTAKTTQGRAYDY
ncbi:hypothetical protein L204_101698 [Cryptococcus depauperatus]|nr:hypothetical protein L204_04338 [Cryptococcus depauperatus CBS 7855]